MKKLIVLAALLFQMHAMADVSPSQDQDAPYALERANYWGSEIAVLRNWSDMQECARSCDEDSSCVVASYHDQSAGDYANTCVHRSKVGSRHPEQSNVFSWVRPSATGITNPVDAAKNPNYIGPGVYDISRNRIYRYEEGKLFDDSGNVYAPDVTSQQISKNGELVMVYHENKNRWEWIEGAPSKTCLLLFYCVDKESIIRSYKYRSSVLTTSERGITPILTIVDSKYVDELGEPVFSLYGEFCGWCDFIVLHNYYERVYISDAMVEINARQAVITDAFGNTNSLVVDMFNWGDNFEAKYQASKMLYFTSIEGKDIVLSKEQVERIKNRWLIVNQKRWHSAYAFDVPEAGHSVSKRQAERREIEGGGAGKFVLEIKVQPEHMAEFRAAIAQ
jgi:hypothetical protein